MYRAAFLLELALLATCGISVDGAAWAQDESDSTTVKVDDSGFKTVLQRIRAASLDEDWKAADWKDPVIEKWLSSLESDLCAATKRENLKLPVTFEDVDFVEDPRLNRVEGALRVEKSTLNVTRASNSIILSDANVQIGFADHCVIIARGAVTISHASDTFVVAGNFVNLSHARTRRSRPAAGGAPVAGPPSVVMCGGPIEISHASNVICSTPQQIKLSFAENVDLINAPLHKTSHGRPKSIDAKIAFEYQAEENPLRSRIQVTETVHRGSGRSFVVVKKGDVEYVVREGAQIIGLDGKPLPGLEKWKLDFVANALAVFSDGERLASFPLNE